MANIDGMDYKFTVIKNEDIFNVDAESQNKLAEVLDSINENRKQQDKIIGNAYLVVNTDEPYADEIIDILKRNGHWG